MQSKSLHNSLHLSKIENLLLHHYKTLFVLLASLGLVFTFYVSYQAKVATLINTVFTPTTPKTPNTPTLASGAGNVQRSKSVSNIVTDAMAFYNSLSSTQQATLQFTYTTTLARKWSNLTCGSSCRNGIQLGTNLTATQYTAAMQIIKDALGTTANNGYDEFHMMNLAEAYLHANGGGSGYDSVLRWMAFLGTPSATGAWMLQFGGHHYAANIAINNGHVIGGTPFFMGLEPKTFVWNSVTYDPLGDEKTAFATALSSLSSSQLSTALISSSFTDCVMIPGESNGGATSFPSVSIGQPLSSLTTTQQNLVLDIIKLYVGDMDTATYRNVLAVYQSELSQTYISYHGSGSSGSASSFLVAQGDYGRISGPTCWIEFSCQGGIVIQGQIHYHTVWRDRSHDYGVDLSGAAIDGGGTSASGIESLTKTNTLNVFPNPANTQISFMLNEAATDATISIANINGQVMKSVTHFSGTNFSTNVSTLPAGNYIIRVIDNTNIYVSKFVKQ